MKKSVSLFLCGVFVSALVLSGCNSSKDETRKTRKSRAKKETTAEEMEPDEDPIGQDDYTDDDPSYDDTSSDDTSYDDYTYTEETFNFAAQSYTYLDGDKLQQVSDLYDSYVPDHKRGKDLYADGIPGSADYYIHGESLYFDYDGINGQSSISIHINAFSETAGVYICLYYDNDRFYGYSEPYQSIELDGLEAFIDSMTNGDYSSFEIYDDSALVSREEDVKKDIAIIYSRLITFADNAFPELGFGLEDLGISLGDKFRSIDPTQPTSAEHFLENEHQFVNGVCSDCGMLWYEYFYEAIGIADGDTSNGWRSIYGQDSAYMLESSDYIQLSSYGDDADIFFHHMDDNNNSENCRITIYPQDNKICSYIGFDYEQGMYSAGRGLVDYKFEYRYKVSAELGEFDKIFESKEAFAENCEMYLFVKDDTGVGQDVWGTYSDDEIREMFKEVDGCTYYTKEEMTDMIWEHLGNYFNSMDAGMTFLDTDLAEAGINWK